MSRTQHQISTNLYYKLQFCVNTCCLVHVLQKDHDNGVLKYGSNNFLCDESRPNASNASLRPAQRIQNWFKPQHIRLDPTQ